MTDKTPSCDKRGFGILYIIGVFGTMKHGFYNIINRV